MAKCRVIQTNYGPISGEEAQFLDDIKAIAAGIARVARELRDVERQAYIAAEIDDVLKIMKTDSNPGRRTRMHLGYSLRWKVRAALEQGVTDEQ